MKRFPLEVGEGTPEADVLPASEAVLTCRFGIPAAGLKVDEAAPVSAAAGYQPPEAGMTISSNARNQSLVKPLFIADSSKACRARDGRGLLVLLTCLLVFNVCRSEKLCL